MTLLKRNDLWFPTVNDLFGNFFDDNGPVFKTGRSVPAVNIKDNDKNFEVEVAAPGMDKKDFKLSVENDVLTISAEKEEKKNEDNKDYSRKEFSYESFERKFTLPQDIVEASKIEAKYENGILKINIPKKEEKAKLSRTINIK